MRSYIRKQGRSPEKGQQPFDTTKSEITDQSMAGRDRWENNSRGWVLVNGMVFIWNGQNDIQLMNCALNGHLRGCFIRTGWWVVVNG